MDFRTYAKAVVAALVSGITALSVALEDGSVSPIEGCLIALAVLGTGGGTYATTNAPAGKHAA